MFLTLAYNKMAYLARRMFCCVIIEISTLYKRFAEVHYEALVAECAWARILDRPCTVEIHERPSATQRANVLRDRLWAVGKMCTSDSRGRWFGTFDKACDIIPVWTAILVSLSFREMCIAGHGLCALRRGMVGGSMTVKPSSMDKGVLKCIVYILLHRQQRAEVMGYVATHKTFRARSGLRTANHYPCYLGEGDFPWDGHAGVSAAQKCTSAAGGFISELNEAIESVRTQRYAIQPNEYMRYNGNTSSTPDWRALPVGLEEDDGHNTAQSFVDEITFLQPGQVLLEHISARTQSQALSCFGLLHFAALVHPDEGKAMEAYSELMMKARRVHDALDEMARGNVPHAVADGIRRLARDDVYMEALQAILCTESVKCVRIKVDNVGEEGEDGDAMSVLDDAQSSGRDASQREGPTSGGPRFNVRGWLSKTETDAKVHRTIGYVAECGEGCPCAPNSYAIRRTIRDMCTALHGTKFCIEDAFNSIRRAREAKSCKARGRAELNVFTKYMAQHACSMGQEGRGKSAPVKMDYLDFEGQTLQGRKEYNALKVHFQNQQKETCTQLYRAVRCMTGLSTPRTKEELEKYKHFEGIPPGRRLGHALVEELVCTVPQTLWQHAWKNGLVPNYTIMYHVCTGELRVKLATPGPFLVCTWKCTLQWEKCVGGGANPYFALLPGNATCTDMFNHCNIEANVHQMQEGGEHSEFDWLAIRTDPISSTVDNLGNPTVGNALAIAVPRKHLKCLEFQNASHTCMITESAQERSPRARHEPMPTVMDSVPIVEWIVEEGLRGMTQQDARALLEEVESTHVDNVSELQAPKRLKRQQAKVRCTSLSKREVFDRLLGTVCGHFTAEEREAAQRRYSDHIDSDKY